MQYIVSYLTSSYKPFEVMPFVRNGPKIKPIISNIAFETGHLNTSDV